MRKVSLLVCLLLTVRTLLQAEQDPGCAESTVGQLLDQSRTDFTNLVWGAAGVVIGLAAAEKMNTRVIAAVTVPSLKQANDYLVASDLRNQLSKLDPAKRVKVCRGSNDGSLLPKWLTATLGFKSVVLITEPKVDVPHLKFDPPPAATAGLSPAIEWELLRGLQLQGDALKQRQAATTTPLVAGSGKSIFTGSPAITAATQNPNLSRLNPPARPYAPTAPTTIRIRGSVYDQGCRCPIADATVQISDAAAVGSWVGTSTSNRGDFAVTMPAHATYLVSAFAPGYYGRNISMEGTAAGSSEIQLAMKKRSLYPCSFTVENQTRWTIVWQIDSSIWQPVRAFQTLSIHIESPGDFHSMATFQDGPPIYWRTVPVDCDGPGYTRLVPPAG